MMPFGRPLASFVNPSKDELAARERRVDPTTAWEWRKQINVLFPRCRVRQLDIADGSAEFSVEADNDPSNIEYPDIGVKRIGEDEYAVSVLDWGIARAVARTVGPCETVRKSAVPSTVAKLLMLHAEL